MGGRIHPEQVAGFRRNMHYERWYDVRCRSTEELAALQALMIRAAALGFLGEAWVELQPRLAPGQDRAWWATAIDGLVHSATAHYKFEVASKT